MCSIRKDRTPQSEGVHDCIATRWSMLMLAGPLRELEPAIVIVGRESARSTPFGCHWLLFLMRRKLFVGWTRRRGAARSSDEGRRVRTTNVLVTAMLKKPDDSIDVRPCHQDGKRVGYQRGARARIYQGYRPVALTRWPSHSIRICIPQRKQNDARRYGNSRNHIRGRGPR